MRSSYRCDEVITGFHLFRIKHVHNKPISPTDKVGWVAERQDESTMRSYTVMGTPQTSLFERNNTIEVVT
ncbi:MAG TPA: hypothetical protein DIW81_19435 [Planctomycetaceae bacterium]|nr:hypothetical protein [Rubinisphaera sp.]HCS53730.1 hypothetical protein [Planctomycetaceae bacterium]